MVQIDTLIIGAYVIPVIPRNTIWHDKAIAINDGKIVEILNKKDAEIKYTANNVYNLNNHAVFPGLINAHTHVPMNIFRGLADDLQLFDWLQNHIWPAEADVLCPEAAKVGTKLAIAEMLLGGTTCFYDMFFFTEELMEATTDTGMRAILSLHVMDVSNKWAKDADECLEKSSKIIDSGSNPLITLALAPQSPYTNCDSSLIKVREMANERNMRIMIHLQETRKEIEDSMQQYGKRPIQRLHDIGFLGPDVMAVHMVHLNDADRELAIQHQLSIAHCPESNLKLASGFGEMLPLRQAGLKVAIGTDSVASNNDLDMLGEMRQAAFLAKALNQDPTVFAAHEMLEMATIDAASAMGLDNKIGSLEVGKHADITAIDLSDPQTQPLYNPVSQILYAANRKQVSHVWVNGEIKVDMHQLTDINHKEILQQASEYIKIAKKYQA